LISDSAHSFGAQYHGKRSGALADVSSFSFHAVKNLTTAEGGALCFDLPKQFNHDEVYKEMCTKILHGQNKDALAKTQKGNWKYDVEEPGFKCNMTDIQAAIGLVELERYQDNLERRKVIFDAYTAGFKNESWAIQPLFETEVKTSSYHLYLLRVAGITEAERDAIIQEIFEQDVSVNVHFQPLPILTAYKKRGYKISDYPEAYSKFANEISLPVYYDLSDESVKTVIATVKNVINHFIV
jgi:dTDP-4-amino-4,6-dideoxygalactose transaminase